MLTFVLMMEYNGEALQKSKGVKAGKHADNITLQGSNTKIYLQSLVLSKINSQLKRKFSSTKGCL